MLSVLSLITVISSVCGLIFNGYIIIMLISHRKLRTTANIFLLHLGLVNLITSLFCIIFFTSNNFYFVIPSYAQAFTSGVLIFLALWSLVGFHYNRYLTIAIPLHYFQIINRKRITIFLVFQWILGIFLTLPLMVIKKLELPSWSWYNAVYVSGALCLPMTIIIVCNIRCYLIARYHKHRISNALYEVSLRAQAAITPNRKTPLHYKNQFKVIYEVIKCLCPLVFLYSPVLGILLAESGSVFVPTEVHTISNMLFCLAPVCHGLIYGVCSRMLGKKLKEVLQRLLYESEVNIEAIQRQSTFSKASLRTAKTQHIVLRLVQEV